MSRMFSFEDLDVWNECRSLVTDVYTITNSFPIEERFALSSQLKRAVVSVPSNIAEGSGRASTKEKIHFLEIAYGSLIEVYCQLQLAVDLNYLSEEKFNEMKNKISSISKMLSGLRNHFKRTLTPNP